MSKISNCWHIFNDPSTRKRMKAIPIELFIKAQGYISRIVDQDLHSNRNNYQQPIMIILTRFKTIVELVGVRTNAQ